jgi:hypothetical protein
MFYRPIKDPAMQRAGCLLLLGLTILAFTPPAADPARGCAPAFREGASVRIAGESAVILWDSANKKQHFIRRATFDTETADFGFLVPTPSKPELAEAPDEVFSTLQDWTKPEVVTQVIERDVKATRMAAGEAAMKDKAVEVLHTQRVAGMDAVVLKASDPKALTDWLNKHGYATREALTEWFKPYIEAKWLITAFKFAKEAKEARTVAPRAVRMSFAAERPFYPYREPSDQHSPGIRPAPRLLRVFFVGDARMDGFLGEMGKAWPGRTVWANTISAERRDQLLDKLKLTGVKLLKEPWLTEMEDESSPRSGSADVYFARAKEQAPVARPPLVNVVYRDRVPTVGRFTALGMALGVLALIVVVGLLVWRYAAGRVGTER